MIHWLSTLSWLQLCWLGFGIIMFFAGLLVWYSESHARKVDGASGWMLFGWLMTGAYGIALMLGLSAVNWFLRRG